MVKRQAPLPKTDALVPQPIYRCMRVFAFDPQASTQLDTAIINNAVIQLPWEKPWEDPVALGPANEYVEVVDFDPSSGCFYQPLDPNDPAFLGQNGLPPSDGNPQFHQQMVFAVAMKTIRNFERALGRPIFWMREGSPSSAEQGKRDFPEFVRSLRIYPHAMREANAFYSPQRTALLFGYFRGAPARDGTGGEWIFTCLSQDIIAHETTHAILHGLWRRSVESTNVDTLAFHEAFADVVALLQHFSSRSVIEYELARSGGNLRSVGLLTGLAQQFGRGTGREGPLRFALKMLIEEEKKLAKGETLPPDRNSSILEPHARGQILVAAIFDAFVTIFERRTKDLFRMAGMMRGASDPLPHELVTRLAQEAEKTSEQVLRMCIRGLDYLPPVDATFGEYLRAIVTADVDLVPDDPLYYRTAFAESFSKRGIRIDGQVFSSTETLYWEPPDRFGAAAIAGEGSEATEADCSFWTVLSRLHLGISYGALDERKDMTEQEKRVVGEGFSGAKGYTEGFKASDTKRNLRDLAMTIVMSNQAIMHEWFDEPSKTPGLDDDWERLLGILFWPKPDFQSIRAREDGVPKFEVQSVRVSRRQSPDGDILPQLLVQVVQSRRAFFDEEVQRLADKGEFPAGDLRRKQGDFTFRGGVTLIVDLRDGRVQRVIRKRVTDNCRLARVRAFMLGDASALGFGDHMRRGHAEPFAFLHREADQ